MYSLQTLHFHRITCKDGFSISVQAHENAYCTPRDNFGPYTEYEVGFPEINGEPTTLPDSWAEYADGGHPNDVYCYVPVKMIQELVDHHGGIDIEKSYQRHKNAVVKYDRFR